VRSVQRQDHHCPFASNCIGRDNYHYFFLFNMYTFLSGVYSIGVSTLPHMYCDRGPGGGPYAALCDELGITFHAMFLLSLMVAVILGVFFALMAFMAARGLTTNEFMNRYVWKSQCAMAVSYDLGSARRNLEAVFGPARRWWRYLVPGLGRPLGHVSDTDALLASRS
jgi:hypothetical protein